MSDWEKFIEDLIEAVHNDDLATVQRLRSQFTNAKLGFALLQACQHNSVAVAAELLSNPSQDILAYAPDALDRAAQCGHAEILKIVLPHTNPKIHESNALVWAVCNNQQPCVDVLFDVSDVDVVWQKVNEQRAHMSAEGVDYFEQRMMARAQHAKLTEEVKHGGGMRGVRKL